MHWSRTAGYTARCTATVGAVVASLVTSAPASSASTNATGSAFALAATGPVTIAPVSAIPTTSAKQPVRKSLAELPPNSLASASALTGAAWAGHGRASVADLRVRAIGLVAGLVTAKCENNNGVAHLVKATLGGRRLTVHPRPNSALQVQLDTVGTVSLTLNKQVRDADGGLTVTAIELSLPLGPGRTETISISSVTCGRSRPAAPSPSAAPTPSPSSPAAPSQPTAPAPAPTPVPGDLAVTG